MEGRNSGLKMGEAVAVTVGAKLHRASEKATESAIIVGGAAQLGRVEGGCRWSL
jgi:hypothetical protein